MADLGDLAARRAQDDEKWRKALRDEHARLVQELKDRRLEQGLTQQQVASAVGVSRGQIANAEGGTHLLSVETLIGYALAVGVRLVLEEAPKS